MQAIRLAAMFQLSTLNFQLYGEDIVTSLCHQECKGHWQEKQPPSTLETAE